MGTRPLDGPFIRIALALHRLGVKPYHLTLLQIPVYIAMLRMVLFDEIWWFFWLAWIPVLLDGGDGILARVSGQSTLRGAALDATMDFTGIVVIASGVLLLQPTWWAWVATVVGLNGVLYLQNDLMGEKAVSYMRGPLVIGAVEPRLMGLAIAFCLVTTLTPLVLRTIRGRALWPIMTSN